jgi:prophage regulatory protein
MLIGGIRGLNAGLVWIVSNDKLASRSDASFCGRSHGPLLGLLPVAQSPIMLSKFVRSKEMKIDIVDRLAIDPGKRTLGELLQEREAAAQEIGRLRTELERLRVYQNPRPSARMESAGENETERNCFRAGTLLRLRQVCEYLGISRSTIYNLMSKERFPRPVRLGPATVRWSIDDIDAWRRKH